MPPAQHDVVQEPGNEPDIGDQDEPEPDCDEAEAAELEPLGKGQRIHKKP